MEKYVPEWIDPRLEAEAVFESVKALSSRLSARGTLVKGRNSNFNTNFTELYSYRDSLSSLPTLSSFSPQYRREFNKLKSGIHMKLFWQSDGRHYASYNLRAVCTPSLLRLVSPSFFPNDDSQLNDEPFLLEASMQGSTWQDLNVKHGMNLTLRPTGTIERLEIHMKNSHPGFDMQEASMLEGENTIAQSSIVYDLRVDAQGRFIDANWGSYGKAPFSMQRRLYSGLKLTSDQIESVSGDTAFAVSRAVGIPKDTMANLLYEIDPETPRKLDAGIIETFIMNIHLVSDWLERTETGQDIFNAAKNGVIDFTEKKGVVTPAQYKATARKCRMLLDAIATY